MFKVNDSKRRASVSTNNHRKIVSGPVIMNVRSLRSAAENNSSQSQAKVPRRIETDHSESRFCNTQQTTREDEDLEGGIVGISYNPIDLSVTTCSPVVKGRQNAANVQGLLKSTRSRSISLLPQVWHLCELCDGSFRSKFALMDHIRVEHRVQRMHGREPYPDIEIIPIDIPQPGPAYKNFSKTKSLADEIIYHPPAGVTVRRMSSSSSSSSSNTQERYPGSLYSSSNGSRQLDFSAFEACRYCGQSFQNKPSLMSHVKREHPEESRFGCTICDKVLSSRAALLGHIRTHTGEKPFVCQFCSRAFSNSQTLTRHLRTHTGERPYECPICGKKASLRHNMKLHIKIHEKQMMYGT